MILNKNYIVLPLFALSFAAYAGPASLFVEKNQMLNNPEKSGSNGDTSIGINYSDLNRKSRMGHSFELDSRFYVESSGYAVSLPEAYFTYEKNLNNYSIGRKILDWSPSDQFWMLGNINGLKGLELISGDQEGIVGLHLDRKWHQLQIGLVGSFIHIPSMNPSQKIVDGKIVSTTDWAKTPPSKTKIKGVTVPIYYKQDRYNTSDIIFQETLGLFLKYKTGFGRLSGYGIYKPENSLRMNAVANYNQDNLGQERVDVLVTPYVNHQTIYGLDFDKSLGDVLLNAGFQSINPNTNSFDKKVGSIAGTTKDPAFSSEGFVIAPTYDPQSFFHSSLSLKHYKFQLSAKFLQLLSQNTTGDDISSTPPKWHQAVGGEVNYKLTSSLFVDVAWRYDMKMGDNLFKGEMGWKFNKNRFVHVGMQLLDSPTENSYWSSYRANDAVYSRFSLLF